MSETAPAVTEAAIAGVGKIGSRTAVRFTDGRVRWYAVAGLRPVLVSAHAVERGVRSTSPTRSSRNAMSSRWVAMP